MSDQPIENRNDQPIENRNGEPAEVRIELAESDVREVSISDVAHPLADRVGTGADGTEWVATETRSRVVHLSPIRLNFLSTALRDGRRPVLISDELTRLTPSFNRVWRLAGGVWVVRETTGGLRNGSDGRRLSEISDAWTLGSPLEVDDIAVNYLRPIEADSLQLSAMVALRHPARAGTVLGAATEELSRRLLGALPRVWGASEPADTGWDRSALTALIREHMPEEKAVFASGPGLAASISAQRTEHGVEEVNFVTLGVGAPDGEALNRLRIEASGVLQRLAETSMPLVGVLLARPGTADVLVPPYLTAPPIPLALLIGAPAVRSFGLSVDSLREKFGAQPVGRPRIPALLFDLGALEPDAWRRLDAILSSFDQDKLAEAFGRGRAGLRGAQLDRPGAERPDSERPDSELLGPDVPEGPDHAQP